MNKFKKLKQYYDNGLWDESRLKNAVLKGWITQSEFEKILSGDDKNKPTKGE